MQIDLLGNDYRYGLSPSYMGAYLGANADFVGPPQPPPTPAKDDPAILTFAKGLLKKVEKYGPGIVDSVVDVRMAEATSAAEQAKLDQVRELARAGLLKEYVNKDNKDNGFDIQAATPWIIGGGVLMIAVFFMAGTRRRRR